MRFLSSALALPLLALLASQEAQDPPLMPHQLAHQSAEGPAAELAAVIALEQAEEQFQGDMHNMWMDVLATRLLFIGDHRRAMEIHSQAYTAARGQPRPSDGSELAGYEPRPAIQTILKLAEGQQVLMLNEEHRSSRERAFANELLQPLHEAGFTHLALETIGDVEAINQRRHVLENDGFYTRDPVLADLVRRARELGMQIVRYEADMRQIPEDVDRSSPIATTNWREGEQARNLAAFLEENPEARLIVWSGRHHMSEAQPQDAASSWTPMGGIFKSLTGIDPLTIDLMLMNELARPELEQRTFRWATEQGLVKEPVIFMNQAGEPWSPLDSLDAAVFFPRTEWLRGRPAWLRMGGLRAAMNFDWSQATDQTPTPDRPLLIEARLQGEPEEAVPVDRVIWREGDAPPLFVRLGNNYRLVLRDPDGNVIAERVAFLPGR